MEEKSEIIVGNQFDDINHPKRYAKGKIECIDGIESATCNLVGIEAVDTANVIKYMWRWKDKEPLKSLEKAQWYLNHLIEHVKKGEQNE